jgi:hypothetical protein
MSLRLVEGGANEGCRPKLPRWPFSGSSCTQASGTAVHGSMVGSYARRVKLFSASPRIFGASRAESLVVALLAPASFLALPHLTAPSAPSCLSLDQYCAFPRQRLEMQTNRRKKKSWCSPVSRPSAHRLAPDQPEERQRDAPTTHIEYAVRRGTGTRLGERLMIFIQARIPRREQPGQDRPVPVSKTIIDETAQSLAILAQSLMRLN